MRANLEDNLARRVRHIASRFGSTSLTLQGLYDVSPDSGSFHFLNPGLIARTVRLPAIEVGGGQLYVIVNTGSGEVLNVVSHSGVSITDVSAGRTALFFSSSSEWRSATIAASTTPENAVYLVGAASGGLTAERVVTDTGTISWDFTTTPGVVYANATVGGGNVSNQLPITADQLAVWVNSTTLKGVTGSTLFQPLDADLTQISALTGTNTIYWRSASGWLPVTFSGIVFSPTGELSVTVGGGNVSNVVLPAPPAIDEIAVWTGATTIKGVVGTTLFQAKDTELTALAATTAAANKLPYFDSTTTMALADFTAAGRELVNDADSAAQLLTLGAAPLASPDFTGTPTAPTKAFGTNPASIATLGFIKASAPICQTAYAEFTTYTSTPGTMSAGVDGVPVITDGTELFTVSITPKAATNRLRIRASGPFTSSSTSGFWIALFRDSTPAPIVARMVHVPVVDVVVSVEASVEVVSGSTAPTTFRLRWGHFNGVVGTLYVNGVAGGRRLGGSQRATIEILEIQA